MTTFIRKKNELLIVNLHILLKNWHYSKNSIFYIIIYKISIRNLETLSLSILNKNSMDNFKSDISLYHIYIFLREKGTCKQIKKNNSKELLHSFLFWFVTRQLSFRGSQENFRRALKTSTIVHDFKYITQFISQDVILF